ncbi:MAG: radical SAM protein [Desulfobacteraceae bacterium]|nr:radical SAM protein [Desulfobacteraceae bacterium]
MGIKSWIKKQKNEIAYQIKWKRYFVKFFLRYGYWDFFSDFNVEINTSCNRKCTYCPNNLFERGLIKNEKLMDEKIYFKLIDELAQINFKGRLSPQCYGEPLLDKRLTKFMRYTKEKLPKTRLTIVTNGDYLTVDKFNELLDAGVDKFSVTQHGKSMSKNMKQISDYLETNPKKFEKIIKYNIFDSNTPLYNRGGLIKPELLNTIPRCIDPGNPVTINHDGNVILCCNDYFGTIKFGNLKDERLLDIWFSKKYVNLRKQIRKRQYNLPICKKCVGIEQ